MADWFEVTLQTSRTEAEVLEQWLFDAGALSVTLRDGCDDEDLSHAVLEPAPAEVRLWETVTLVGLFPRDTPLAKLHDSLYLSAAVLGLAMPAFRITTLAEREWARAWMDDFHPMQFGEHFWICPTGQAPPDTSAINLRLDPGMAFGTGTHATTAQCLAFLGAMTARSLRPLQGCRVIDYGCGSGVLAIAALLLGADSAWAVDIDPQALTATHDNAVQNGVIDRLKTGQPDLVDGIVVELVLANILFKPLMDLTDSLARATCKGGRLVVSGILEEQMEPLRLRYNEHFEFETGQARDGWALMTAIRR
jgi:ribosomal protein L11 methyltransferase